MTEYRTVDVRGPVPPGRYLAVPIADLLPEKRRLFYLVALWIITAGATAELLAAILHNDWAKAWDESSLLGLSVLGLVLMSYVPKHPDRKADR